LRVGSLEYPERYRNLGAFFVGDRMGREIAIMIDGGFLSKRIGKLVNNPGKLTPDKLCEIIRWICRAHVKKLTGDQASNWHRHIYRIFYYDAPPFEGQAHHPFTREQIDFGKSELAVFQQELFKLLRKQRNVALRLGTLSKLSGWTVHHERLGKLLRAKAIINELNALGSAPDGSITLTPEMVEKFREVTDPWETLEPWMAHLDLRQKGVDMRIGLDIASVTLKRLASTIILVAGDADFVPAAKLARREGVQFILDPLWQSVSDDLFEHIDGLQTVLRRPEKKETSSSSAKKKI
jgi:uncharacterized LabA/DUF88 family protein